jgi:hypothetical protein
MGGNRSLQTSAGFLIQVGLATEAGAGSLSVPRHNTNANTSHGIGAIGMPWLEREAATPMRTRPDQCQRSGTVKVATPATATSTNATKAPTKKKYAPNSIPMISSNTFPILQSTKPVQHREASVHLDSAGSPATR